MLSLRRVTMLSEAATFITAASGVLLGVLGWVLNRRRAHDDRQASLIDDLETRTSALSVEVQEATVQIRSAGDYIVLLRSTLLEAGIDPPPWPDHLRGR